MKRMIKKLLRAVWNRTSFLRRPILGRFANHLVALETRVAREAVLPPILDRIDGMNQGFHHKLDDFAHETNLLLDGLIREIARLQSRIETLEASIDESRVSQTTLTLVDESGREREPVSRTA